MNVHTRFSRPLVGFVCFALVAAIALLAGSPVFGALVVTPTNNANVLTNTILGSGVTIVGTPTYIGGPLASGTFSGGGSAGIGMEAGIILTSGLATNAIGPNNSGSVGFSYGTPGDAGLNTISGGTTHDAAILEFDFTTSNNSLYFNFVFGSEEYNEYVGSQFNDAFAFFLDNQNIALIPSTTTPVTINNVNLGANSAYYNNNSLSPPPYHVQYDGFTDVLMVSALNLSAGTHHIKLAIADTGDSVWDSGVFIQAGTFSETPTVPEPASLIVWSGLGAIGLAMIWRNRKRRAA